MLVAVEREVSRPGSRDPGPPPSPWPAVLLVVALMAVLLRFSSLRLNNTDTWFHLVLGERFRHGWSLRSPGSLSPFATSDWVPTQWSTEVVASQLESWFGLPGVAWFFGALYLALLLTVYGVTRARCRPFPAAVITAMVVLGAAPALSARPQVLSLLLLAVVVHAWLRSWEDGRARWWLVPLTWVWATAHGLWSAGVLVGVVCCVGIVLDRRADGRQVFRLVAVPVLSVLAAALTPVGPELLTSQLAVSARTSMIAEWGATSFRTLPAFVVAAMAGWLVVLWARRGGASWTALLLFLLAAGWTMLVVRMVPLGAVLLAPLLAGAVSAVRPGRVAGAREDRLERRALAVAAAAFLVGLALAVPHTARTPAGVPTALQPALSILPPGTPVVVEDGTGAWLEWAVPQVAPVVDGLLDAYPVDYLADFTDFRQVRPGWQGFLGRTGARVAVVRVDSPLRSALQGDLGWRPVQRDRAWVLLDAPVPQR